MSKANPFARPTSQALCGNLPVRRHFANLIECAVAVASLWRLVTSARRRDATLPDRIVIGEVTMLARRGVESLSAGAVDVYGMRWLIALVAVMSVVSMVAPLL